MRIFLLAISVAVASPVLAQTLVEAEVLTQVRSGYAWRGQTIADGPVFQPSASISFGGFALDMWGNMNLDSSNDFGDMGSGRGRFTEWDTTLSYSTQVGNNNLSLGISHFDYPNTGYASTTEIFAKATGSGSVSPFLEVNRDIDEIEGTYIKFGAEKIWELTSGSTFTGSVGVGFADRGYNNGYFGVDRSGFNDLELNANYSVPLSSSSALTFSANYQTLLDRDVRANVDRPSNASIGIGFSQSF